MGLFRSYFQNKNKEGRGSLPRAENRMLTVKSEETLLFKFYKIMSSLSRAMICQLERAERGEEDT